MAPYAPTRIRTRSFHLIRALLNEGHRVSLATLYANQEEAGEIRALSPRLDGVLAEKMTTARSLWNCVKALPSRRPCQACYSWSPALARGLARLAGQSRFDVVHVEHIRGVRYGLLLKRGMANRGAESPAVVWDSVDCISSLFRQAAEASLTRRARLAARLDLRRTERYEGLLGSRFDRVLVTSAKDRLDLLQLAGRWGSPQENGAANSPEDRFLVVPNGVDLDYFSPPEGSREARAIVISGKMSYHANVTAVIHFVNSVMPRIWSRLPDARLWIVGKDPPKEVRGLGIPWARGEAHTAAAGRARESRVLVTGTVDDIRPFLRRAALAVAPVRYAAGIQNKVLEALACGLPVVATPEAVSALEVRAGHEILVARDPADLAASIVGLLENPQLQSRLSRAGRRMVERRHRWSAIARDLTQIYLGAMERPVACAANGGGR